MESAEGTEKLIEDGIDAADGTLQLPENWMTEINLLQPVDQQFKDGNYPLGQV